MMDAPAYFSEHKKLIKMLLDSHKKQFVKDAKAQIKKIKAQKKR